MENHVGTKMGRILGEHGGTVEYAVVECIMCGTTAREDRTDGVSDDVLARRFRERGWTVLPTRCPEHAPRR